MAALRLHHPQAIAMEPTGPYHLPLLKLLQAAHLPVGLVHPAQAKALRVGMGHRNKGDRTDALALARIALSWPEALQMVEGQLETLGEGKGAVEAWLKEDLERLKGKLKEVEARVEALLSSVEEARVLLQEPGAGLWVVAAVLAYLPPGV